MELVAVSPDELVHSILEEHGDVLAHYASPYYDPVKAKEYYERTKQLKGRQPTTTKSQSEAIGYANKQIGTAKSAELKKLAAERDAKLKDAAAKIKQKLNETIEKRADAILKRLENLPKNASPELVAKLTKSHAKNANKARQQAQKEVMSAFKSIRSSYANKRVDVGKKYVNIQKQEESNLRANVR